MVTDSIWLEELATGWLRLTIVWSLLMGFIEPPTGSTRAVDVLYLWRPSGTEPDEEEVAVSEANYPTATTDRLLHLLPDRSWSSIKRKANKSGITVLLPIVPWSTPVNMSLTDLDLMEEFAIEPGKPVQWRFGYFVINQLTVITSLE